MARASKQPAISRLASQALLRLLASLAAILFAVPAWAADQPEATAPSGAEAHKESLTAIDKALTDPVSEAWSIVLQQNSFRISPGIGRGERWSSDLLLEIAMPVALTPDWNLITRPFIDLFHSQPHPQPDDPTKIERTTAFGDITLPQLVSPSKQLVGNWLLGLGPTWIFPTGVSRWTTSGKWQVGPAAVVGYLSQNWILAAFLQNWTSFGGSGPNATNTMSLEPIANYFFPNGWSIGYSGTILANWKTSATNAYTVPIGVQVAKVVRLGPLPVKFALAGQWMPVHPANFGQVWGLQLFVQALRPKLLKGYLSDPASLQFRWDR
jgi:hypothetical protein